MHRDMGVRMSSNAIKCLLPHHLFLALHARLSFEITLLNFLKHRARYLTPRLPEGTGCKGITCLCAQV